MNWIIKKQELQIKNGVTKYQILQDKRLISFQNWIDLLKSSNEFIQFYIAILKESRFKAYFWEVKSITKNTLQDPFEFVLVNSSALVGIKADDLTFQKYFKPNEEVVSFANLGGDAQLIVPTPQNDVAHYNHIASFIRNAPNNQITKFWKKVGIEYEKQIGTKTKWLSTSGLGVYWLHVRIDSRPKYYQYTDYKVL